MSYVIVAVAAFLAGVICGLVVAVIAADEERRQLHRYGKET